ncbi:YadA-like family protein [Stenotrophomonas sp. SORGH_AS_0321]|uniref:YadA-like family protein n=1 Tax=Stenotrophomonas sp. SORGH_AS_0321 TaxID=3041787 RepID=UPI0028677863|nr:YadA-like family protein [Stenotrophomonas sp. SORGH_AS_0321]MDR6094590.1 autotransporter adhesin [Stenotrophomonas sp. SORGH_AS_0321]
MNRIFRLVWSRQLRAMVVASELATGAHGASSLIDQRAALPAPAMLAVALALALCAGTAAATENNQTLRDLQALTAKYTQQAPVKVDAEVTLAALAGHASGNALANVDASVSLGIASSLPVVRTVLPAKVDVAAVVRTPSVAAPAAAVATQLGVNASVGAAAAPSTPLAAITAAVDAGVTVAPTSSALVQATLASAVQADAAGTDAVDAKVAAHASVRLDAKEEELVATDAAVSAALDTGVAGGVGVNGDAHLLAVADRNPKLATQATAAAQASGLNLGSVVGGVGSLLDGVGNAVGGLVQGDLNGVVGGVVGGVGGLVGGVTDGLGLSSPSAIPPTSPKAPRPADPNSGLIIGSGGLVGTLSTLVGPTAQGLLGGDGYVRNGNLAVSSANVQQTYSVTNVLGVPVVNLTPVGTLLNGLGGATTGGSSHLTLIGGVTSDSYIYNINNGDPNGLLGLLLPGQAPDWAASCLNVLGVVSIDCWAVNPAQDYQVLMGDGAYANGSREVVIGANASHRLPLQDANVAFPGNGVNDPSDPTGVPTADYAARMGHSVIVGDSASGTANGQVLLGAEATSNQANSVALGYRSSALRGAQASYNAYGLDTAQVSSGEVSVGFAGGERQISNVAAGSLGTDAVNVAQLQGAVDLINAAGVMAITYDDDGTGAPNFRRATLGGGTGTTTLANVADGVDANDAVNVSQLQAVEQGAVRYDVAADGSVDYRNATLGNGSGTTRLGNLSNGLVAAGSTEAITGAQLLSTNEALVAYFGGTTAFDPATALFTAPAFAITSVAADGVLAPAVYDNASDAFAAVDGSLVNLNTQINDIRNGEASRFFKVNSAGVDAAAGGLESVAIGGGASAAAANAVAIGSGSIADRDGTVSIGAAGAERQLVNVADATAATDAVNLGQLQASEQGALRYDIAADGSVDYSSATLGNGATATTLSNLGAGEVSASSSEAINGAQLFASSQSVATRLGGGAGVDASGAVTAPTYTLNNVAADGSVSSGDYNDVGSAFDAVSSSLANVADKTDTVDRLAVKYDADASGNASNRITLAGDGSGSAVLLDNLADGSVTAGSRQAVTGNQLSATNQTVANYFGGTTMYDGGSNIWTAPTFRISSIATDGTVTGNDYGNVTVAFSAVDSSLLNINQRIDTIAGGNPFLSVNSAKAGATASGVDAVAVGPEASAAGAASVAIGDGADASAGNSVALGAGSVADTGAQAAYTGAYGQAGASNSAGEVSVGSSGGERKVTHVADGSERYDAVNVGQLQNGVNYAIDESKSYTDQQINNINNGTSGMFQVNNSQGLANPSASGANAAAGGAGASAAGANATALGNGAQARADNAVALGAGSVADRANTVSVGSAGAERQIANVADGSQATDAVNVRQLQASQQGTLRYDNNTNGTTNFSSVTLGQAGSGPTQVRNVAAGTAGTDAVNVDQLRSGMAQTLDWSKAYTDERMDNFDRNLKRTDDRASAGIASAMAVASLPQPSEAGRSMASFAAGSFNGESGMAVGLSGVSDGGRWIYKFSGSTNTRGDGGVAVGAGIQW